MPHTRRSFLADTGMGFTGLALGGLLFKDGFTSKASAADLASATPDLLPHHAPRAKSVIWIFLIGGVSHMESFDPKPTLSKFDGQSLDDTPLAHLADEDRVNSNLLRSSAKHRKIYKKIKGLQTGFKPYGRNGTLVSDWFPNIGGVIDDIALVRSMWTLDNNHGAQLTFHTGRKINEGAQPTVGSWASYGLGSLNKNLPEFVVLGEPSADCCGRSYTYGPSYLGAEHGGVRLKVDPKNPLAYVRPSTPGVSEEELRENFSLLGRLNQLSGVDYPEDDDLKARIKSYELAFQMQSAVPELMQLGSEPEHVRNLYGLDKDLTKSFGSQLLAARRMAERGVRFIQVFHGYNGGAGRWDSHKDIKKNHAKLASEVDLPTAGLLRDLKQRGMLDDTLVVWGTEFGRTPGAELRDKNVAGTGRDHHPHGFTCWLAGGGIKGGTVHGATDELGFHAVEDRHYVTDLHATVLHQLGLDPRKLQYPGRKRLEMDYGEVIQDIVA